MRLLLPSGAFFALQGSASALDGAMPVSTSLLGSMIQMVAALAVVLGIILLFYYVACKVLKIGISHGGVQKYIRVIENRFLAPKKSLLLIEVGGEYLLLSCSGDNIRFVKQINMLEEIEVLGDAFPDGSFPGVFQNKIIDLVSRLPKKGAASPSKCTESGGGR